MNLNHFMGDTMSNNQTSFGSSLKYFVLAGIYLFGASSIIMAQDYALDFNGSSQYVDCRTGNLALMYTKVYVAQEDIFAVRNNIRLQALVTGGYHENI